MYTIDQLPILIATLDREIQQLAERLLQIEQTQGVLTIPASMEQWVIQHFGELVNVREQTITRITNRYTLESAIFNPLRARRPAGSKTTEDELEDWITTELHNDIFADALRETTADTFGRITGEYCVSAANIAKYAAWHGLVIPYEPHPLRFTQAQIRDYLDVALRWIAMVQTNDSNARYPLITWNCLPKSGATIVHCHWQIAIAQDTPFAQVEIWRRAIDAYRQQQRANYIDDLFQLHHACKLSLAWLNSGDIRALAHITPLRSHEVILVAPPEAGVAGSLAAQSLADAMYSVLRRLIDQHGVRAFNMAIAIPPALDQHWQDFPVLVRIGDRGPPLTSRGDIGAMELYGTGVIAVDPYEVAM
jgi:hypothetical protein